MIYDTKYSIYHGDNYFDVYDIYSLKLSFTEMCVFHNREMFVVHICIICKQFYYFSYNLNTDSSLCYMIKSNNF